MPNICVNAEWPILQNGNVNQCKFHYCFEEILHVLRFNEEMLTGDVDLTILEETIDPVIIIAPLELDNLITASYLIKITTTNTPPQHKFPSMVALLFGSSEELGDF